MAALLNNPVNWDDVETCGIQTLDGEEDLMVSDRGELLDNMADVHKSSMNTINAQTEKVNNGGSSSDHAPNLELSPAYLVLKDAADAICERQITRDDGDEKSMKKTLEVFDRLTGVKLKESQGWLFMACVKLGRSQQGKFHIDDYIDAVAYIALSGEAADKESQNEHRPESTRED